MAYSKRRDFQTRRQRGYRIEKSPKGFDRFGMPIICGFRDQDGKECQNRVSLYGHCDDHYEQRMRRLGRWKDRPELFERRST